MPYTPTWNNPYLPQGATTLPYQPTHQQYQQPYQQTYQQPYQQLNGRVLVDGPTEAMNRILMRYPANQLVPGFISDELFDVNGRQFYVLSVEADGRRNLETFDYAPHTDGTKVIVDGVEFESREEFDTLAAKVRAVLGVHDGIYATVQAGGSTTTSQATGQSVRVNDAGQDRDPQGPDRGRPSGDAGPTV